MSPLLAPTVAFAFLLASASGEPPTPAPAAPAPSPAAAPNPAIKRTGQAGTVAGKSFEDSQQAGFLVGLRISVNRQKSGTSICGIQPIYLTPAGPVKGGHFGFDFAAATTIEARNGYAIGGLTICGTDRLRGMKITFRRIMTSSALSSEDSYDSQWFGDSESSQQVLYNADPLPAIGLFGTATKALTSLGLIVRPAEAGASTWTPPNTISKSSTATKSRFGPEVVDSLPSVPSLIQKANASLVFIDGPQGKGSGFLTTLAGQKVLLTNAHVLASVGAPSFRMMDRSQLTVGTASLAPGPDVAALTVAGGQPLEPMDSVEANAQVGDEIVVLGNADGAGVVRPLEGRISGIGPDLVEVTARFVPGNSGSPIIHRRTGKVIGVATYVTVRKIGAAPFATVGNDVRYFGYRFDKVEKWQPLQWPSFRAQAAEIERCQAFTEELVGFLTGPIRGFGNPRTPLPNLSMKPQVSAWLQIRQRKGVSPQDMAAAKSNLLSYLQKACQEDLTQARAHASYAYFQGVIARVQEERNRLSEAFVEVLKMTR